MPEPPLRTPDELEPKLHHRLRQSLELSGLRVTDMAAYLEVHRVTVGAWLNGRATPNPANIRLWAMRTNVPYEWLKTGKHPDADPAPTPQAKRGKQRVR